MCMVAFDGLASHPECVTAFHLAFLGQAPDKPQPWLGKSLYCIRMNKEQTNELMYILMSQEELKLSFHYTAVIQFWLLASKCDR